MTDKEINLLAEQYEAEYYFESHKEAFVSGLKIGLERGKDDRCKLLATKAIIKELCGIVRTLNNPNVQLTDVDGSLKEAEKIVEEI